MKHIAIFASGNGTNCENIIKYFQQSESVCVSLVISSKADALVVERAKRHNIPVSIITKQMLGDSQHVLSLLKEYHVDLIVLAGFLLFMPEYLIKRYQHRIVNIHPSLLPKYGGKGMYGMHVHQAVKDNHEKISGITIHYVSLEYDKGQIIAQYSTPLSPTDTVENIAKRVHSLEYEFYPRVIETLLEEL